MDITIRNISDTVIKKIRTLSQVEKRSLNNQILIIIERGIEEEVKKSFDMKKHISRETQIQIWSRLANSWQDDRTTSEIIQDIYENRTLGREFSL